MILLNLEILTLKVPLHCLLTRSVLEKILEVKDDKKEEEKRKNEKKKTRKEIKRKGIDELV